MLVTLPIPDDFARRFGSEAEAGRRALEGLALVEYRAGRLDRDELQSLLEIETGYEADGFLKSHGVIEEVAFEEFEQQMRDMDDLGS